jgi:hypothetical protein
MRNESSPYAEPVSVMPSLAVFIILFLLLNMAFRVFGVFINLPEVFVLPFVIIILLISSYSAIQFFIKKHKRYFLISELLFISMGSIISIWFLQALIDGVLLLGQSFPEAMSNSALSVLLESAPVVFAYMYLGRYMLSRYLANQAYQSSKDKLAV